MKNLNSLSRQILLPSQQTNSRGLRRFNSRAAAFSCALLSLLILCSSGIAQGQQPDPLTITTDGKVGIGTSAPANKLSVQGSADVSGSLGIGTSSLGTSRFKIANASDYFAHFRFDSRGNGGELEFVGWDKGWNINSRTSGKNLYLNRDATDSDVLIGPMKNEMIVKSSGSVGIGTTDPGTSKFRIANASDNFAHFRFDSNGNGGELEFTSWANGWNINSKTSGKNLYLNRDAEATSDVLIGPSKKEMIVKGNTGNVGIGTTNPQFAKLQIAGGVIPALRLDADPGVAALRIGGTGELLVNDLGVNGARLIVKDNGNVGIGTGNPTKAKLEISGSVGFNIGNHGFLNPGGNTGTDKGATLNYSVWASNNIAAMEFHSFSDARIKNIQGRSDSATDLRTLLGIEVTNYRYKDVFGRGNGAYKKVTGQQVEKVFPQAVSKHTEVLPDIYRQASIQDGWVTLTTDLKNGERVKLITEKGEEGIYEVLEVTPDRFRIDFKSEGNRVFVYGREVKDFLTVDYEAISMLNVSATQQIKKEKDAEVTALQAENAALRRQLAEQEKRLAELETKDKTRDEKLAAIETLLLSADKPVASSASLKKAN